MFAHRLPYIEYSVFSAFRTFTFIVANSALVEYSEVSVPAITPRWFILELPMHRFVHEPFYHFLLCVSPIKKL